MLTLLTLVYVEKIGMPGDEAALTMPRRGYCDSGVIATNWIFLQGNQTFASVWTSSMFHGRLDFMVYDIPKHEMNQTKYEMRENSYYAIAS